MKASDPAFFHKLYGPKQPRVTYYERDFIDYVLMIVLTALVVGVTYGVDQFMSTAAFALCGIMLAMFVVRHGVEARVPAILSRPQDVLYMFVYKLQNLRPMYFVALSVLLLENVLIAATPNLPHHVDLMRKVAFTLFYVHLLFITGYRTAIFIDHLVKKELVREVLMQTAWKRVINEQTKMTLEVVHAYCTGLLTHIVLLAPWYVVITYSHFSVIFLPVACVINIMIHLKWWQRYNEWFYRDHWLAHNSELEFVFLHGTHHDAIPSGMIAGTETGFLEGFLRFALGWPVPFYSPIICFAVCTYDVTTDIHLHQYIPGVFPRIPIQMMEIIQHSTHHYGSIEPYGVGVKVDQPAVSEELKKAFARVPDGLKNSARLDEQLTDFKWENPTHRRILRLFEKYQGRS